MTRVLKTGFLVIIALALALPLGACGKKGDLSPPPSHANPVEDPGGE